VHSENRGTPREALLSAYSESGRSRNATGPTIHYALYVIHYQRGVVLLMDKNSVTYQKSFSFAVRTVNLYKWLCENKKEYILSKQLLRSGTSVGANVKEGLAAQSKKDFIAKYSIALKEASEAEYWIELLEAGKYIDNRQKDSLISDLTEIMKLLTASVKTAKGNPGDKDREEK